MVNAAPALVVGTGEFNPTAVSLNFAGPDDAQSTVDQSVQAMAVGAQIGRRRTGAGHGGARWSEARIGGGLFVPLSSFGETGPRRLFIESVQEVGS